MSKGMENLIPIIGSRNPNGLLVDPVGNCNDFARTDAEIEVWFIFTIMVAGHEARQTANKVQTLFEPLMVRNALVPVACQWTPFEYLRYLYTYGKLDAELRKARTGCYTNYVKSFTYIARSRMTGDDLRHKTIRDLIQIPSVGLKTASFFIMSTRENVRMAALDTHLLKFLRDTSDPVVVEALATEGLTGADVPKATPGNPDLYARLERAVLWMADFANMTPQEFDFAVWKKYARAARNLPIKV